jgi:hypothetical protein
VAEIDEQSCCWRLGFACKPAEYFAPITCAGNGIMCLYNVSVFFSTNA